jgi:hypothetical protein
MMRHTAPRCTIAAIQQIAWLICRIRLPAMQAMAVIRVVVATVVTVLAIPAGRVQ